MLNPVCYNYRKYFNKTIVKKTMSKFRCTYCNEFMEIPPDTESLICFNCGVEWLLKRSSGYDESDDVVALEPVMDNMIFNRLLNELSGDLKDINIEEIKENYKTSPEYILGFYESKFGHLKDLLSTLKKMKKLYEYGSGDFNEGVAFTLLQIIKALEPVVERNKLCLEAIYEENPELINRKKFLMLKD